MVFSAFFSGVEIAFVSVDKLRFEMERKGGITSRILSIFFKNPNEFISTMLVGNNIALVIYGILMAQIIGDNLLAGFIDNHFLMVLAQTVISTLIILVTGEFLPKTIFKSIPIWSECFCHSAYCLLCGSLSHLQISLRLVLYLPSPLWNEG